MTFIGALIKNKVVWYNGKQNCSIKQRFSCIDLAVDVDCEIDKSDWYSTKIELEDIGIIFFFTSVNVKKLKWCGIDVESLLLLNALMYDAVAYSIGSDIFTTRQFRGRNMTVRVPEELHCFFDCVDDSVISVGIDMGRNSEIIVENIGCKMKVNKIVKDIAKLSDEMNGMLLSIK